MLSNLAIILIVLVCALTSVSLAAGIFGVVTPSEATLYSPSMQQQRYMRQVRFLHVNLLLQENSLRSGNVSRVKRCSSKIALYKA
ncbi:hypothetical protein N7520_011635 [Penicillium odoratum]|uniref:uncharacterized protein n=1 Tax=Penicillium odoratum TaxID=1167516 RepID=UPI002547C9DE|nr:uncharacterized protein N7520_011635 [Penicillium odoratum]KAJ5746453.1 hypothetical protein N7520_011635 [Penicillium odoratum]